MGSSVNVRLNGADVEVPAGTVVAAAIARAGLGASRTSVGGAPRTALCGMGICQECRVTINGRAHERGCLRLCETDMEIETDDARTRAL